MTRSINFITTFFLLFLSSKLYSFNHTPLPIKRTATDRDIFYNFKHLSNKENIEKVLEDSPFPSDITFIRLFTTEKNINPRNKLHYEVGLTPDCKIAYKNNDFPVLKVWWEMGELKNKQKKTPSKHLRQSLKSIQKDAGPIIISAGDDFVEFKLNSLTKFKRLFLRQSYPAITIEAFRSGDYCKARALLTLKDRSKKKLNLIKLKIKLKFGVLPVLKAISLFGTDVDTSKSWKLKKKF